ncbi:MAG TPA: hypothetical protein VHY76_04500 [Acetobacteraceae bacterium]|nr:hypothetical protein [Acetobacteraceae bacterium]
MTLIFVVFGATATLGGCAWPPSYAVYHRKYAREPAYQREPVRLHADTAMGPDLPLPVPPQPPVRTTEVACARAHLSEARQRQLFEQFADLEKSKQRGDTPATVAPSASSATAGPPPCGSPP